MSAISEKVRKALYGKLNVAGVTTYVGTRIYHGPAPANAVYPFVIFQRQASAEVDRTFSGAIVLEADLWQIRAVTDEGSSATLSAQELGAAIVAACETAIGTTMTLSGNSVHWCRRQVDMPEIIESVNDRAVYNTGFLLRVGAD